MLIKEVTQTFIGVKKLLYECYSKAGYNKLSSDYAPIIFFFYMMNQAFNSVITNMLKLLVK